LIRPLSLFADFNVIVPIIFRSVVRARLTIWNL